nr:MAG TPA: hypothetical protein [Caudoviricetes sp.]
MRPDDAISGDCLIKKCFALVCQNKRVISDAALNQRTGNKGRVTMHVVLFQLGGSNGCAGMCDQKAKAFRQAVRCDLDHIQAVQTVYNALLAQFNADVAILEYGRGRFQQRVIGRGENQHTPVLGDFCFIHCHACGNDLLIDVVSRQGFRCGLDACLCAHDRIDIAVTFGNDLFTLLPCQSAGSFQSGLCFVLIQLVNRKREAAILGNGHFLGACFQRFNHAVAAFIAVQHLCVALVVRHGRAADLVNFDGMGARPCEVLIRHKGGLGFGGKQLVNGGLKIGCIFNHRLLITSQSFRPKARFAMALLSSSGLESQVGGVSTFAPVVVLVTVNPLPVTLCTAFTAVLNASGSDVSSLSSSAVLIWLSVKYALQASRASHWLKRWLLASNASSRAFRSRSRASRSPARSAFLERTRASRSATMLFNSVCENIRSEPLFSACWAALGVLVGFSIVAPHYPLSNVKSSRRRLIAAHGAPGKGKVRCKGRVRSCNAGRSDRGSWHTHSQTVQQRAVRSRTAL